MAEFKHRGIVFYYEERGEGLPFFFLHGLGSDCAYAYENIDGREGVRLLSLDQQGHGRSGFDWEHMDFNSMGDDIIALADALGIERFYLGGVSMGAGVSVNVAVRFPERLRGLLLVRPAWIDRPMPGQTQEYFALLARFLPQENGAERFLEEAAVQAFFKKQPDGVSSLLGHFKQEASRRMYQKYAILPRCQPIVEESCLQAIDAPTWVAACRNDVIHPYEYGEWYAERIPGARFVELPEKSVDAAQYHRRLNEIAAEMLRG